MVVTDPIADMLTRIRNALVTKRESVEVPSSKIKKAIAQIMLQEGYLRGVELKKDGIRESMVLTLKYGADRERVVTGLKRISTPGLRVYVGKEDIPKVLGGLGIAILSTPKGVMTDRDARSEGVGGEVLAYVW